MIYKLAIEAFAATPEVRAVLERVREDRLLSKSKFTIVDGGLDTAPAYYADRQTPQLVIVEETSDDQAMLEHLAALAEVCVEGTRVVVIGQLNDIHVYRTLIQQGVSEYLVSPVSPREVVDAIASIFSDPSAPARGKVLAFYGARGGVGSSTIAQNVAWSLSRAIDDDVVLVDLDLAHGTAGLALNLDSKQTVGDILANPDRADQVLIERFLVRHDDHLQVLLSPADLGRMMTVEADALERVLELVRQLAPYVVLDLPHHWAGWIAHALVLADDVVVTALPDLANLRDCKNLWDGVAAKRGETAPTRLLLNRMDAYKKTQLSPKDFEETLGVAPFATLPFDPQLFGTAANNGQMLGEASKGHKVAESITQMAVQLTGRQQIAAKKNKSLFHWLKGDKAKGVEKRKR
ncbi:MAG: AAA family ATPase [Alphaproteobacteria bacterium]|nr:AAA family ATPase [Alphaproteobacteria bacterium]